jgi:hypothetical protein
MKKLKKADPMKTVKYYISYFTANYYQLQSKKQKICESATKKCPSFKDSMAATWIRSKVRSIRVEVTPLIGRSINFSIRNLNANSNKSHSAS